MSVDASILLPAIRKERWVELYNSIIKSTKRFFFGLRLILYSYEFKYEKGETK